MSAVTSMRPWQMTRYLASHGWSPKEALSDAEVEVYESPIFHDAAGEPIRLFVPRSDALPDFSLMRDNLIRALSELEGQPPESVAREMLSTQADVFSARVLIPGDGHRLLFKDLLDAFRALFDLFMSAASAEVRKPTAYFSEPPREARRFAGELLIPAPTPGSFVLQIESPLDAPAGWSVSGEAKAMDAGQDLPLGRRVMVRVMRGLRDAPRVHSAKLDELFTNGLNANMCDALGSLNEGLHGMSMDFGVRWAPQVVIPEDVRQLGPLRYEPRHFEVVREIGSLLRQPRGPRQVVLVGHVVELRARRAALTTAGDQVALLSTEVDNRTQPVKLSLEEKDYQAACLAHLERRPVRVEGVLERIGKSWQITKYSGFTPERG